MHLVFDQEIFFCKSYTFVHTWTDKHEYLYVRMIHVLGCIWYQSPKQSSPYPQTLTCMEMWKTANKEQREISVHRKRNQTISTIVCLHLTLSLSLNNWNQEYCGHSSFPVWVCLLDSTSSWIAVCDKIDYLIHQ